MGPQWKCKRCSNFNPPFFQYCNSCNFDRGLRDVKDQGTHFQNHGNRNRKDEWVCPGCKHVNVSHRTECFECHFNPYYKKNILTPPNCNKDRHSSEREHSRDRRDLKVEQGHGSRHRSNHQGPSNINSIVNRQKRPGDWRCPKCNYYNFFTKEVCNSKTCGFRPTPVRTLTTTKYDNWNCLKCNFLNFEYRRVCYGCRFNPHVNESNRETSAISDADNQQTYNIKADAGLVDCTGRDNLRQISFDAEDKKNIKITLGINVSEKDSSDNTKKSQHFSEDRKRHRESSDNSKKRQISSDTNRHGESSNNLKRQQKSSDNTKRCHQSLDHKIRRRASSEDSKRRRRSSEDSKRRRRSSGNSSRSSPKDTKRRRHNSDGERSKKRKRSLSNHDEDLRSLLNKKDLIDLRTKLISNDSNRTRTPIQRTQSAQRRGTSWDRNEHRGNLDLNIWSTKLKDSPKKSEFLYDFDPSCLPPPPPPPPQHEPLPEHSVLAEEESTKDVTVHCGIDDVDNASPLNYVVVNDKIVDAGDINLVTKDANVQADANEYVNSGIVSESLDLHVRAVTEGTISVALINDDALSSNVYSNTVSNEDLEKDNILLNVNNEGSKMHKKGAVERSKDDDLSDVSDTEIGAEDKTQSVLNVNNLKKRIDEYERLKNQLKKLVGQTDTANLTKANNRKDRVKRDIRKLLNNPTYPNNCLILHAEILKSSFEREDIPDIFGKFGTLKEYALFERQAVVEFHTVNKNKVVEDRSFTIKYTNLNINIHDAIADYENIMEKRKTVENVKKADEAISKIQSLTGINIKGKSNKEKPVLPGICSMNAVSGPDESIVAVKNAPIQPVSGTFQLTRREFKIQQFSNPQKHSLPKTDTHSQPDLIQQPHPYVPDLPLPVPSYQSNTRPCIIQPNSSREFIHDDSNYLKTALVDKPPLSTRPVLLGKFSDTVCDSNEELTSSSNPPKGSQEDRPSDPPTLTSSLLLKSSFDIRQNSSKNYVKSNISSEIPTQSQASKNQYDHERYYRKHKEHGDHRSSYDRNFRTSSDRDIRSSSERDIRSSSDRDLRSSTDRDFDIPSSISREDQLLQNKNVDLRDVVEEIKSHGCKSSVSAHSVHKTHDVSSSWTLNKAYPHNKFTPHVNQNTYDVQSQGNHQRTHDVQTPGVNQRTHDVQSPRGYPRSHDGKSPGLNQRTNDVQSARGYPRSHDVQSPPVNQRTHNVQSARGYPRSHDVQSSPVNQRTDDRLLPHVNHDVPSISHHHSKHHLPLPYTNPKAQSHNEHQYNRFSEIGSRDIDIRKPRCCIRCGVESDHRTCVGCSLKRPERPRVERESSWSDVKERLKSLNKERQSREKENISSFEEGRHHRNKKSSDLDFSLSPSPDKQLRHISPRLIIDESAPADNQTSADDLAVNSIQYGVDLVAKPKPKRSSIDRQVTNRLLALAGGGNCNTIAAVAGSSSYPISESDNIEEAGNENCKKTAKDSHAAKNIGESESSEYPIREWIEKSASCAADYTASADSAQAKSAQASTTKASSDDDDIQIISCTTATPSRPVRSVRSKDTESEEPSNAVIATFSQPGRYDSYAQSRAQIDELMNTASVACNEASNDAAENTSEVEEGEITDSFVIDYSRLTDRELRQELESAKGPKRDMLLSYLGIEVNESYNPTKKRVNKNVTAQREVAGPSVVYLDSSDDELGLYSPCGSDVECLEDEEETAEKDLPENSTNNNEPSEKRVKTTGGDIDPPTHQESYNQQTEKAPSINDIALDNTRKETDNLQFQASADNQQVQATADIQQGQATDDNQQAQATDDNQQFQALADYQQFQALADYQQGQDTADNPQYQVLADNQQGQATSSQNEDFLIHDNSTIKDIREALKDPSQVGAILASLGLPGALSSTSTPNITSSLPPSTPTFCRRTSDSTPSTPRRSTSLANAASNTTTSTSEVPQILSSGFKDFNTAGKESGKFINNTMSASPSFHRGRVSRSPAHARSGIPDTPGSSETLILPVRKALKPPNQDSAPAPETLEFPDGAPEAQEGESSGMMGQSETQADNESDSDSVVCLSMTESEDEVGLYSPDDPDEIKIIE